eukprot:4925843-Karenia_brevis.AAC.1
MSEDVNTGFQRFSEEVSALHALLLSLQMQVNDMRMNLSSLANVAQQLGNANDQSGNAAGS